MDRLDVLKRTTASATLMKSSSGDIVISGRRNHHGVAEEDKSAHQSLKEPDKCHKLDMKVAYFEQPDSETDSQLLTLSP